MHQLLTLWQYVNEYNANDAFFLPFNTNTFIVDIATLLLGSGAHSSAASAASAASASAADQIKLDKQTHVETIMASVHAMRAELARSPKDLATAAYVGL